MLSVRKRRQGLRQTVGEWADNILPDKTLRRDKQRNHFFLTCVFDFIVYSIDTKPGALAEGLGLT